MTLVIRGFESHRSPVNNEQVGNAVIAYNTASKRLQEANKEVERLREELSERTRMAADAYNELKIAEKHLLQASRGDMPAPEMR